MLTPLPMSGYVLAGGRSSRMGTDKSLLPLAGKPLVGHAVAKLRGICSEVNILSSNPSLSVYAPLVPDIHPDCGPIGGIEAALSQSQNDWNLILPVDVPFIPAAILRTWAAGIMASNTTVRVAMFEADGRPQPAVCLLHKEIAPSIAAAVALGEFKLVAVLEASAEVLALQCNRPLGEFLSIDPIGTDLRLAVSPVQRRIEHLWFANLNTPEDFAEAETQIAAPDT